MGLGGAETHVLELSRALTARGHDVTVASAGGVYAEKLRDFGVRHEEIPLNSKKPSALSRSFCLLSRLMERERFDIVHAHARIPAFICGRLRKKYGFAFITTVHFDFCVNPVLRSLSDWGERTLAVSEDLAESTAKKYGLLREKIKVIHNGVDTVRFSPQVSGEAVRKRFGLEGKTVIMYLGRLDGDSFLPARALIDAARDICSENASVRFLIVGDGEKYGELCRKARQINEEAGRELLLLPGGTQAPEEYFAACDVFVGPSRSALEALACGKAAVLAGNFGMLGVFSPETAGEAVRTNFCCRGSAPITAERVRTEVLRLLSLGEKEKAELAEYGREFVCKRYSAEAMALACEKEYASLLAEKGKKAVICGYYGAGNAGDEAMLAALIRGLRRCASIKSITVISSDPRSTEEMHGVCAVCRHDLRAVERALAAADALIFGGGNILQDKTSTRSLLYYAYIAHLGVKHACRVAFSSNGIGPVKRKKNMRLVQSALLCADYVSMRESRSLSLARRLMGGRPVFASGELAFLCGELASAEPKNCFAVFPKLVENCGERKLSLFCSFVRRKYGLLPLFIPMHAGEDTSLCRKLAKKAGGKVCASAKEALPFAVFSLCMRLHAAVFSASASVPVIAVSDDAKIGELFRGSGACVFGAEASVARLCRAAEEVMENAEEKKKLSRKFAGEQKRLAEKELARLAKQVFQADLRKP